MDTQQKIEATGRDIVALGEHQSRLNPQDNPVDQRLYDTMEAVKRDLRKAYVGYIVNPQENTEEQAES